MGEGEREEGREGRLEETIPYTMVRKIFTTRNNKSTRELYEEAEKAARTQLAYKGKKSCSFLECSEEGAGGRGRGVCFRTCPIYNKRLSCHSQTTKDSFGTQGEHFLYKV